MRIIGIAVDQDGEGTLVTVKGYLEGSEELTVDDAAQLQDMLNSAASGSYGADDPAPAPEPEPEPVVEQPKRGRGRPPAATKAPEPEPAAPARRRAAPAPAGISDEDLVKACSAAAAKHPDMPALIPLILDEVFGVKNTADVPADKRQAFLDEVDKELQANLAG